MSATITDTIPQAVTDATAALAARVLAAFGNGSSSDQVRHAAISNALYTYGGNVLGDPAAVVRTSISLAEQRASMEMNELKGLLDVGMVAPQIDPLTGGLVNPLEVAAKASMQFESPALPDVNMIKLWSPDSSRNYNLERCFVGCGPNFDGLTISSKGGAYGVSADWKLNGLCLPAFSVPQHALQWFEKNARFSAKVWMLVMRNLYRQIISRAIKHKFTLEVDANNNYVTNGRAAAPNPYGHYRCNEDLYAPPIDPAKLAPLSPQWLTMLANYYVNHLGFQGASGTAANGAPMWDILDSQPNGGWLYHAFGNNPAFNTQNQEFQKSGNILSPYGHQGISANAFAPWNFRHSRLFKGLTIDNITGALVPIRDTVALGDIDAAAKADMGIILGDVDYLNPATRNPYGLQFIIAPTNMAKVLSVSDPYLHAAVGSTAWREMHSGAGFDLARPLTVGQIAPIVDTYYSFKAVVIPNTDVGNASTGIVARAHALATAAVNMCNVAAVTTQTRQTISDECPRDPSFRGYMQNEITGPSLNDSEMNVIESRNMNPGTDTIFEMTIGLRPGQTVNYFNPLITAAGGTVTVVTVNADGVATTRRAATLTRAFQFDRVGGGVSPTGQIRVTLGAQLPAGSVIRSVHPSEDATGAIEVIPGSVEYQVDETTGAQIDDRFYVQVSELSTPAQWAVGATKSLVTYAGAVAAAGYNVTLIDSTELPNEIDGNGVRLLLGSANAAFTYANLRNATRITLS